MGAVRFVLAGRGSPPSVGSEQQKEVSVLVSVRTEAARVQVCKTTSERRGVVEVEVLGSEKEAAFARAGSRGSPLAAFACALAPVGALCPVTIHHSCMLVAVRP